MDKEYLKKLKKRILKKTEKTDYCWIWKSSKNKGGYGRIKIAKKFKLAHRMSWIVHKGEIPKGILVCHKCDNRDCVRPSHLFLGTHRDNVIDMHKKGRGRNMNGEKNPLAKLTEKQAVKIKYSNKKVCELAKEYGVYHQLISSIKQGRTWRHI